MNKTLFYFAFIGLLASCGGEESSEGDTQVNDGESSVVGNVTPNSDDGTVNNTVSDNNSSEGSETTSIEYFDLVHDFGSVFYPSDNKFTFKFKNTGDAPLVIEKATASCGCTIPNKPEEPIMPGAIGELDVIFRPKSGQVGSNVTKKITVVANTEPRETYLEIKAFVMDAM